MEVGSGRKDGWVGDGGEVPEVEVGAAITFFGGKGNPLWGTSSVVC